MGRHVVWDLLPCASRAGRLRGRAGGRTTSRSRQTAGSAFSWIVRLAEVCCTNRVQRPSVDAVWSRTARAALVGELGEAPTMRRDLDRGRHARQRSSAGAAHRMARADRFGHRLRLTSSTYIASTARGVRAISSWVRAALQHLHAERAQAQVELLGGEVAARTSRGTSTIRRSRASERSLNARTWVGSCHAPCERS